MVNYNLYYKIIGQQISKIKLIPVYILNKKKQYDEALDLLRIMYKTSYIDANDFVAIRLSTDIEFAKEFDKI